MKAVQSVLGLAWGRSIASAITVDYIVVGAGTSGLVVANRISEDPSVTVAVIEPGIDERNNPNVTDWRRFTVPFGTHIDWSYPSTPQLAAVNRELTLHQGKAWGGTSTLNGMVYVRGDAAGIDAWEELGNKGWNWKSLLPYYKKSEKYNIPTEIQIEAGATYDPQYHGVEGKVHVGYPSDLEGVSLATMVKTTWEALGIPQNPDLNSGMMRGFAAGAQTLDTEQDIRWDSAHAYYHPIEDRPNIQIIKGTVRKVIWSEDPSTKSGTGPGHQLVAAGVEYVDVDGATQILLADKEVTLSAGAVRSPPILEASGIGNRRILEELGIETKIDLPTVGENAIEQPILGVGYHSNGGMAESSSAYQAFVTMADLFGANVSDVAASTRDRLAGWADMAVVGSGDALTRPAVERQMRLQHDLLFKRGVAAAEIIMAAPVGSGGLGSNFWILFPFARGSVHLSSSAAEGDVDSPPVLDPKLLWADFDVEMTVATGRLARKFWATEPANKFTGENAYPGPDILPDEPTEGDWVLYTHGFSEFNSHILGTASMMSRELGGVVDTELRVYGTANLRVVDASIIPMQVSGHLTSTLYAVAERASDMIKDAAR